MARTSRAVWAKHVQRWQESSLTAQEFADEIGVNPRTLSHWKWVLKKERGGAAKRSKKKVAPTDKQAPVRFTEIQVAPVVASATIDVVINERRVVRVGGAFDADVLRRVLDVIEVRG